MSELVVPGKWKCDKCGFELTSTNLYVKTGTVGPNYATPEPCPNDGLPMRALTWKEEAQLGDALIERLLNQRDQFIDVLNAAAAAMSAVNQERSQTAGAISALETAEHDVRALIEEAKTIPQSPVQELIKALRAWKIAESAEEQNTGAWEHAVSLREAALAKHDKPRPQSLNAALQSNGTA
jgi:hypothetical protein